MSEIIRVGIADMNVCQAPNKITTIGLGSCVGIVLFDKGRDIAGLVHIMLPDSTQIRQNDNKLKFADTGILALIERMERMGLSRFALCAKIAGGAKMFQFGHQSDLGNIGDRNVQAVKSVLNFHRIKIVAEDTGKDYGRTVIFDPATKELSVVTAGKHTTII